MINHTVLDGWIGEKTRDYKIYDNLDEETSVTETSYRASVQKKKRWIIGSIIAVVIMIFVTIIVNNIRFDVIGALAAFFTHDLSTMVGKFVWNVDLPIMVAALITGAALSLSGTVMQCILKNPLASPFTLGLSNAAAFGAALSTIFIENLFIGTVLSQAITPILAFVFALLATGLIILLTKVTNISAETMVLSGIAVSAIFSAGITLMQYIADPSQLSRIVSWMFGSVANADWTWDLAIAIGFVIAFIFFYCNRWTMNAMEAGEDVAKGLGVDTKGFMNIGLIISSVLAALIVCRFGVIAFVGLLGPHIARMVVGNDHRYLIPISVLFGGLLLMIANIVSINICYPVMLPIGLLTSILGGPAFIYVLIRRYRE